MVNLRSPVLNAEALLVLDRLWSILSGIYFWEFFTTLDYEWRVIRGRLPHRHAIWIYSLSRVACLMSVILTIVAGFSVSINCQLWVSSLAVLFLLSWAAASLLVVLRIIAIWSRHKAVKATSIVIWGTGVAFHINAVVRVRSTWNPLVHECSTITTEKTVLGQIPTIFADLVLILIMLIGLLILRHDGGATFGLTLILWRQAVIWLSIAIVIGAPLAVIAALSNDQLADIIWSLALITVIIAATRMHRSLVDYASGSLDTAAAQEIDELQMDSVVFSNLKRAQAALNSPDQIKITVHTAFEQHATTQTDDHDSYNSTNEQVDERPNHNRNDVYVPSSGSEPR